MLKCPECGVWMVDSAAIAEHLSESDLCFPVASDFEQ